MVVKLQLGCRHDNRKLNHFIQGRTPQSGVRLEKSKRYDWKNKKSKYNPGWGEIVFSYPAHDRFLGGIGADPNRNGRGKNPVPYTPEREHSHEAAQTE